MQNSNVSFPTLQKKGIFNDFLGQIAILTSQSRDISADAHKTLSDFHLFEETLAESGSSMDQVQLQLSQFASSLETCERTVSQVGFKIFHFFSKFLFRPGFIKKQLMVPFMLSIL